MGSRKQTQPSVTELFRAHSMPMLGTIFAISILAGLFGGWATVNLQFGLANLHASIWTFLLVWAGMVGYTAYKRVPSGVIGMGLYVMGVFVLVKPVTWFVPQYLSQRQASEQVLAVQSIASLIVWGLVFFVLAAILFAVGNYFRARAESTVYRLARRGLRTWE